MNSGIINKIDIYENKRPLIVLTANANQNTSFWPSIRNGISPNTVEKIVRDIAIILLLNALI